MEGAAWPLEDMSVFLLLRAEVSLENRTAIQKKEQLMMGKAVRGFQKERLPYTRYPNTSVPIIRI